jgi:enoyl-CoA hydratase
MSSSMLLSTRPFEGVLVLRLNRPEVLNALNLELRQALAQAFTSADQDPTVHVVVLCGHEKAFCAGADLTEYVDASPVDIIERRMERLWQAISSCSKPVIAALQGYALGGGFELAMLADIILVSESAKLGQPEVQIGIMPGGGATQRLTRVAGKFQAMKWLLTGAIFKPQEALQMGLVSEVLPADEVESRALEMAKALSLGPQLAIKSIKRAVIEGMSVPLEQGLEYERKAFQLLFSTEDKVEGMKARLEKRPAKFKNR